MRFILRFGNKARITKRKTARAAVNKSCAGKSYHYKWYYYFFRGMKICVKRERERRAKFG